MGDQHGGGAASPGAAMVARLVYRQVRKQLVVHVNEYFDYH
jgi:hypothetical protein